MKSSYEKSSPQVKLSRKATKDKGWITLGLRRCCTNKNNLYSKWLKTKNEEIKKNLLGIQKNLQQHKKKCHYNNIRRSAIADYYSNFFNNKISSMKNMEGNKCSDK